MLLNYLSKRWKKWKSFSDLGLQLFDAENKDTGVTENASTSFVAVILVVKLIIIT